jgi:FkbM family methyltransferase
MNIISRQEIFDLIWHSVPENGCIVEIGAYTGRETVLFAAHCPSGKIYAFEPVRNLFEKLQARCVLFSNVSCAQIAVSDRSGTAELHIAEHPKRPGAITQASSLHRAQNRLAFSPIRYTHTIAVNTITLDEWAATKKIEQIDLLWIDVQGHEYAVLQGADRILQRVRFVHVEVHFGQAYEGGVEYTEIIAFLVPHGFVEVARDFSDTTNWFYGNILFKKVRS